MERPSVWGTIEWHVDFSKAFQHITFGLPSWFHETIVWFGSTFFSARLITVGPIGDAMDRDGVKQLLVEVHADCQVMLALESNHWLEGFRAFGPFRPELIDRGSMPCLVAAWAMIVRIKL